MGIWISSIIVFWKRPFLTAKQGKIFMYVLATQEAIRKIV